MVIETQVDEEAGIIHRMVTGPLTLDGLKNMYDSWINFPESQKSMPAIWDLRKADLSDAFFARLEELIEFMTGLTEKRGAGYKLAIVVTTTLEFGISRQFQAMGVNLPVQIMVFKDLEDARAWVLESAK